MSRKRRSVLAPLGVIVGLLAGAGEATAATTVNYFPDSGFTQMQIIDVTADADAITVSVAGNTVTINDTGTGGITTADADCVLVNAQNVTCPLDPPDPAPPAAPTAPLGFVSVTLNNGTDSFFSQTLDANVFESDTTRTGNKTVVTGSGNDSIFPGVGNDVIDTGAGGDNISGSLGDDTIMGGVDGDSLNGGQGTDTLDGGEGPDSLNEDAVPNGADSLNGGAGLDFASYPGDSSVTMTFNGQPDDGHPGEGDNLLAIETASGGSGPDTLVGDAGDNTFNGGEGDDVISAGAGNDTITPGRGADAVDGGDGSDEVFASSNPEGPDALNGGAGVGDRVDYCCGFDPVTIAQDGQPNDGRPAEGDNLAGFEDFATGDGADTVIGDSGPNVFESNFGGDLLIGLGGGDEFFAGGGDDVLVATDSAVTAGALSRIAVGALDALDCDLGFDTVAASAGDRVGGDCERRGASIVSESAQVSSKGKATVRVECPLEEGTACAGEVALVSNGKQLAAGPFKATNGKTKKATAKLTKKGRKTLAKSGGSLVVSAEARTDEPPGVTTNATRLQLIGPETNGGGG